MSERHNGSYVWREQGQQERQGLVEALPSLALAQEILKAMKDAILSFQGSEITESLLRGRCWADGM